MREVNSSPAVAVEVVEGVEFVFWSLLTTVERVCSVMVGLQSEVASISSGEVGS